MQSLGGLTLIDFFDSILRNLRIAFFVPYEGLSFSTVKAFWSLFLNVSSLVNKPKTFFNSNVRYSYRSFSPSSPSRFCLCLLDLFVSSVSPFCHCATPKAVALCLISPLFKNNCYVWGPFNSVPHWPSFRFEHTVPLSQPIYFVLT